MQECPVILRYFWEKTPIIQDQWKSFLFMCKNCVTFINHLLKLCLLNLNIDMECTIFKLALTPALLVLQPPHSAHPMAFPGHMCSVEKLYVD